MLLNSVAKSHDEPAGESTDALAGIKRRLDSAGGCPSVQQNVRRHYEHLESLAASLRKLGVDERDIGEHITQVFHEYVQELVRCMESVGERANLEMPPDTTAQTEEKRR